MMNTQNNKIDELSEQFGRQALSANCENDQKAGASKGAGYPTSLEDHKAGEYPNANLASKTNKIASRAFGGDITNKGHKDGVAHEGVDANGNSVFNKNDLHKTSSNPSNLGPGSKSIPDQKVSAYFQRTSNRSLTLCSL
jgi:hypothetical protein